MGFQDAVRSCFSKYISIEGRAPRSEYWFFVLFGLIGGAILGAVDAIIFSGNEMQPLSSLFSLALFLPSIMVGIRRLHDRDMSGWWMLLVLVPLVGALALLVLYVMKGTDGPNRFGPDPLGGSGGWSDGDADDYSQSSIPRAGRD